MRAKISSIYDMGGFKPILAIQGGDLLVFSNLRIKAKISLHQNSVQCRVNLFLAAF